LEFRTKSLEGNIKPLNKKLNFDATDFLSTEDSVPPDDSLHNTIS
jgi:hypothetical protein